jgi:hypothetical protein
MGNVPSTRVLIERTLCGAGYEMGFPEDADIKPQGIIIPLWGFMIVRISLRNR